MLVFDADFSVDGDLQRIIGIASELGERLIRQPNQLTLARGPLHIEYRRVGEP